MRFKHHFFVIAGLVLVACLMAVAIDFNARSVTAMLANGSVKIAPVWQICVMTVLLALLPLLWFFRLSPFYSLLSLFVYMVVVIFLTIAVIQLFNLWVPPAGALLAIMIVYPLWSCRRLGSAQAALDHALQNLQDELAQLGMERADVLKNDNNDPQQSRIVNLALTAKHLRDMHKSRSDTLVFISHDIRAPLGTAMQLLDKFENNKYTERMRQLLERANAMAEGFLQASRAEMVDVNKFTVLDMVSLTQQVIDDAYEALLAKNIILEQDFLNEHLWVSGDFGLLFRAVSNILLNALNYSPEKSVIKVSLSRDVSTLSLKITDQGRGIPEDKLQKLFKRFSRVDDEYQTQSGTGLGLYFVEVTIKKHRGAASAQNKQGQGAEFVITLPLERRTNRIPVEHDRRVEVRSTVGDTL
jgi:signal transduction histidine kinase